MKTNLSSMQRFSSRTKETGQAIVLVAMMIVILIGMLGLAIDGGGMFLLWRDAQNAVDTAALQAAFAYCTSNKDFDSAVEVGLNAADDNGFDNNEVDNWVTIVPAPTARRPANVYVTDNNAIMLVTITAVKPSYFIQLIYGGPLTITVDTIGICSPATESLFEGYSMFAMGGNGLCANNVDDKQIGPSGSEQHYFGPLFSNGGIDLSGGGHGFTFHDGAGVDYVSTTDGFEPGGKAETDTGGPVTTNDIGEEITSFPTLYTLAEFLPANTTYVNESNQSVTTASAGQYWSEAFDNNRHHLLTGTGEVQIDGSAASPLEGLYVNPVGGIKVKPNAVIGDEGVTLVAQTSISASSVDTAISGGAWHPYSGGVAMFSIKSPASPDCSVSGGGAAISFSADDVIGFGILYAPNSGITMSGSDMAWCGALIGNALDTSGSNTWIFGQTIPTLAEMADLQTHHGMPEEFEQFAGRSCDYIDNDTPPYYGLGD